MDQEIKEGRGCGPHKDHVLLKLDHLGAETIMKRLPSIREIAIKFANVDPIKEPIPVVPTIHYQMGGIPTNYYGQVVAPRGGNPNAVVEGLYAIGECACVSVHGANRLGTNSLLDLVVFGRAAGDHIVGQDYKAREYRALPAQAGEATAARVAALDARDKGERVQDVADAIRKTMQAHCGVFRTGKLLDEGVASIRKLAERARTWRSPTSRRSSTPRASRRWNSTTWSRPPRRRSCRPLLATKVAARTRTTTIRNATTRTGSSTRSFIPTAAGSITSPLT